ncbi:SUN domain-containing ossification factor [Drosophila tropicalis]|uniref:SUN domain-containing ossification factor n=1 Tax=Drosophila tropicalis TaxID=46794 RepID=UPI0035AB75B1
MLIRMHLVRFMYINLLLSCCFWLYDNVAAATTTSTATKVATNQQEQQQQQQQTETEAPLKPDTMTPEPPDKDKVLPNYKKIKKIAKETEIAAEEKVPILAIEVDKVEGVAKVDSKVVTEVEKSQVPDRESIKESIGHEPTTTAQTNEAAPHELPHNESGEEGEISKDTSVLAPPMPSPAAAAAAADVNSNYNADNVNVDKSLEHTDKPAAAAVQVPKNQLNNNNNNFNKVPSVSEMPFEAELKPKQNQQQQQQQEESTKGFPEIITELPTVTVTELPLENIKNRLGAVILDKAEQTATASNKSDPREQQEENSKEMPQQDEQILKINDPGGGVDTNESILTPVEGSINETLTTSNNGVSQANDSDVATSNLTEEVPMPVFSEWAQKQMEAEASREQAMELEQQVVNNSAQRRNATSSGNGKPPTLKLRAKNYASPDCGAKIIASNADATNTGAVLSHSSDEYMLSTCGSRIWFIVELCEAIQAQKVELANFELFSSSPKNFTVAVSKRFPTRDWSNVGRFAAEDKRTVQTFDLHPHLFGKFVRVDIHSHYSKEHFCPVSLFRVFGTSEYEAFETEIRPNDELDDFYDDFGGQQDQSHKSSGGGSGGSGGNGGGGGGAGSGGGGNIFQSASDAVMQIVKKAAEVLVKPTKAFKWSSESLLCRTASFDPFSCAPCNVTLVERVNTLISCQFHQLQLLLQLPQLREDLLKSQICEEEYGIRLTSASLTFTWAKRKSYYVSMLPPEQVGALCKLLQVEHNITVEQLAGTLEKPLDLPPKEEQININAPETSQEIVQEEKTVELPSQSSTPSLEILNPQTINSQELPVKEMPSHSDHPIASKPSQQSPPTPADVNIFNVHPVIEEAQAVPSPTQELPTPLATEASITGDSSTEAASTSSTTETPSSSSDLVIEETNPANWESIDNLLTTTVASITAGGGAAAAAAAVVNGGGVGTVGGAIPSGSNGVNLQQKLANGAQSESVFIRLSNRIKALERNMSLSGQYLEELSRRYKKQVEELQQTLTQQTLTVRTLEDQSRRYIEQEQLYQQQSAALAGEVRALSHQVQACILVIIIVGTCIFLMLVMGTVYYRKLRRQTQQLLPTVAATSPSKQKLKLSRRKSYEQMTATGELQQSPAKQRRPSEEAMLILKECGDSSSNAEDPSTRQRKISVCYGSNNNIAANMLNASARASLHKRKGAKNSWHKEESVTDKFFDVDTLKSLRQQPPQIKAHKKKSQPMGAGNGLKRQESAPANYSPLDEHSEEPSQTDYDESLILDDDDLANFIPTSDLAYNEFMPDGPSGYQILDTVDGKVGPGQENNTSINSATKKTRRLSSPGFFKSPFGKSKSKGGSFNDGIKNSHSAHEATSWEWYRLKRNEKHQQKLAARMNANSLDSASLSEVPFPLTSTENSFRILGEAIISSGESVNHNGNGLIQKIPLATSSNSSSGGSTTSSTTKKKQRAFNNIFRKVF